MRPQVQILYRPLFGAPMVKAELRKLYCGQRLSMMEIARRLRRTHATVLYWMKKHQVPRRSWSESSYCKQNPGGDPFTIPRKLSTRQRELTTAALLLYWAEGSKNSWAMQLANLDARMLQLFMKFLRVVCHADERRVFVYVRVHRQFSVKAARTYWAGLLWLPASRIFVYPHTDQRSQASKQWSRHGIATVEFHSTKLKRWLDVEKEAHIRRQLGNGDDHSPERRYQSHQRAERAHC